ncbi:MAG: CvpA family protein [Muribaculaceae bacterium]
MTLLDIVIIVLAVAGGFIGWRKGLTGQLGALAGVLAAIVLCRWFAADLAAAFTEPDDTPHTVLLHTVMSYVVLGVGAYVGVRIIARFMTTVTRVLHLSLINRAAGAIFSVFEWLLGLSILLNMWIAVFPETEMRSSNHAVTDMVMDIGPKVFDSQTVQDIISLKDLERPDFDGGNADDIEQDEAQ